MAPDSRFLSVGVKTFSWHQRGSDAARIDAAHIRVGWHDPSRSATLTAVAGPISPGPRGSADTMRTGKPRAHDQENS
jgi:hypothetical protein